MSEQNVTGLRSGVNIYDDKLVNKTGLGCGCDITQTIGNCKTQILDFELLKNVGIKSRYDMEKLLGKKVFLNLWVKVKEGWRDNSILLKNFGFTE